LLQDQGDLAGARALHERALAIREKTLGPEHPDTAESLNNLALLLQAQGDLAAMNQQVIRLYQSGQMTEAIALAEKTVAIAKQRLGADNKGG